MTHSSLRRGARTVFSTLLSVTVLAAGPSVAQDWTGPSVGLQVGNLDADTGGAADLSGSDTVLGARAYYDVDQGDYAFGFGAQYDGMDADLGGVASIDSVFRLGARGGYAPGPNYVYATGGYAFVTTDAGSTDVGDSNGYFLGLGYERQFTPQISGGAELLYHEFDDFDLGGLDAEATTFNLFVNFGF